ncbi:MAG: hypothetical protein Kow00105_15050 [Phycisphaeraceae bacterium]
MTARDNAKLNSMDTPSDETLARRVQRGCVRSYEALDRRYRARLVYLLEKRTGNREDAEDLTQQALMRAYQRIDRYNPSRPFKTWLITLAVRLAIDANRKRSLSVGSDDVEITPDNRPGPAESMEQQDTRRWLWTFADRVLDSRQRTALWLHYGEDLDARQIARVLGLTTVHVRVLLYRARRTLLKHLRSGFPVVEGSFTNSVVDKTAPKTYRKRNLRDIDSGCVKEGVVSCS